MEEVYSLAKKVVNKMLVRNAIPYREKEDTEQELMRKYVEKKSKIQSAFQGNSKPETYLTAVLYRMCCEVIRSDVKNWDHVKHHDPTDYFARNIPESSVEHKMVINNEAQFLKNIITLFADESARLVLFLKVLYGIPVTNDDLYDYHKGYKNYELDKILKNGVVNQNQEAYALLEEVVKRVEKKAVGGDAIRIWLNKRVDQMINRLNGTVQRSNYDRKTFRILFDYTFSK
ncbi:MAG: hypothetical protein ACQESX_10710 [Bacteroidota bacterium]